MRKITISTILALATCAAVAEVRYEYTGIPVGSNAISIFNPTDKVESYFVLTSAPTTGNYGLSDFLDFGTRIGSLILKKNDGGDIGAHLEVGPGGQITSWSFVIGKYSSLTNDPSLIEVWSNSSDLLPAGDRITVYNQGNSVLGATATAGYWQEINSPVPEPSTFMYLALGLLALQEARRRTR